MTSKHVLKLAGCVAAVLAVYLMVDTGRVALALGAVMATAGPDQAPPLSFWFQLSFIRMFAASVLALGLLLFWSAAQLTPPQQRSFARVVAGTFALLALVALTQQVAIWTAPTGWALAAVLAVVATLCVIGATGRASDTGGVGHGQPHVSEPDRARDASAGRGVGPLSPRRSAQKPGGRSRATANFRSSASPRARACLHRTDGRSA